MPPITSYLCKKKTAPQGSRGQARNRSSFSKQISFFVRVLRGNVVLAKAPGGKRKRGRASKKPKGKVYHLLRTSHGIIDCSDRSVTNKFREEGRRMGGGENEDGGRRVMGGACVLKAGLWRAGRGSTLSPGLTRKRGGVPKRGGQKFLVRETLLVPGSHQPFISLGIWVRLFQLLCGLLKEMVSVHNLFRGSFQKKKE